MTAKLPPITITVICARCKAPFTYQSMRGRSNQLYCTSCANVVIRENKLKSDIKSTRPRNILINYAEVDSLINAGKSYIEIATQIGCCPQTISARARKIGIVKHQQISKYLDTSVAPFINPEDRFKEAIAIKKETLNLPDWYPIEEWLKGPAGKQFMRCY